jgi:hypothetical protein
MKSSDLKTMVLCCHRETMAADMDLGLVGKIRKTKEYA